MRKIFYFAAVALTGLSGCVAKTDNSGKTRAEYERSLADSIEVIRQEVDSCNSQISILRDKVQAAMGGFEIVNNPREAGSYMISNQFRSHYPLSSTGITARINENNQFELIAALSGQPFDAITVNASSGTATSDVVPNDQALNYRTSALTTVLFTGEKADEIGALIADNALNNLTVVFLQGKPVKSAKISNLEANTIAATYLLYNDMQELGRLEHRVPMLNEKIKLLRLHKDR